MGHAKHFVGALPARRHNYLHGYRNNLKITQTFILDKDMMPFQFYI